MALQEHPEILHFLFLAWCVPTYVARDVHGVTGQLADLGRLITTTKLRLETATRVTFHQGRAGLDPI